ncbi:hypothetical protein GCM10020295_58120 [Streptomyces cinereospinus]
MHAVGICGSDREVYQGNRPEGYVRYPLVPGHEWSGTVTGTGPGVPGALVGRKVVGEGFRNCQVCDRCHAGETTLCTHGYEETGFTQPGAMAATLTLPARLLHVLPDDADLTAAALLEPAACVAAAALKARALPGERVAVVGTGTLGMFAVQFLRAASPAELLVVGARPDRAAMAREFGATDFRTKDQPLPGDVDVVIETAGSADAARGAAALLRRGGRAGADGHPGPGRRGPGPHGSGGAAAGGAHRLRGTAGRLGARGAGVRRRAAGSGAAGHPPAAADRVLAGHRVGGGRRPGRRQGTAPPLVPRRATFARVNAARRGTRACLCGGGLAAADRRTPAFASALPRTSSDISNTKDSS